MSEARPTTEERADQSVSTHFTRVMNATPSRWGALTDPSIIGLAMAPVVVALMAAARMEAAPALITALQVLAAVPVAVAVAVTLVQTGARRRVVAWLASVPFPVENMNAVLMIRGGSQPESSRPLRSSPFAARTP